MRVPWLRDGIMPAWLRRRLIGGMEPSARARTVELIWDLIRGAENERRGEDTLVFRVGLDLKGRAPALPSVGDPSLLREEVFLDTLAAERIPDLDLALALPRDRDVPALRRLLDGANVPWPEFRAAAIALVLALAAGFLMPVAGSPLPTGAYLPLILLAVAFAAVWLAIRTLEAHANSTRRRR